MEGQDIGLAEEAVDEGALGEHEAVLVEYPSKEAFLEMTEDTDYPNDVRRNAIEDSRLYCMRDRNPRR